MNTGNYYLINLPTHNDSRGKMCVAESEKEIPFIVKRIFYDFDNLVSSETRGNHANRNSKFVYICVHGSCSIRVNDGIREETFVMNNPCKALYTDKMVWKEMFDYSEDSVLLILSNEKYDSSEYVRSFEEFINIKRGEKKQ